MNKEPTVSVELSENKLWRVIECLPESEKSLSNYLRGLADTFLKSKESR